MDNLIGTATIFTATIGTNTRITVPPEARKIIGLKPKDIVEVKIRKIQSGETEGEKHNKPQEATS